ncbi:MAG: hypothetical protein AUG49_16015 [Catenulispora sp. 13_1_20CM_3_70_7]|nr:MAG: hypothetical protein AUG49_16015 [Catenulispora sp. 13_1_20CM_3_70_7]
MDAEMRTRLQEARRRAIPLPWRPPFTPLIELGPDRVHKALVAEAVVQQLRPCYKLLDGFGMYPLAFELRRICNVIQAAGEIARQVA